MSPLEILFTLGLTGIIALIAIAGRWAADHLDEVNGTPKPLDKEGRICAWCHPGVPNEAGHGICKACAAEVRASYLDHQSEGGA